jgi:tetratricopeptide (TPR) repeat protein
MLSGAGDRYSFNHLEKSIAYFHRAATIDSTASRAYLHQAEAEFDLGERRKALESLITGGWEVNEGRDRRLPSWTLRDPSPLFGDGSFEHYLTLAYLETASGNWDAAVMAFRPGLAFRGSLVHPQDFQTFYRASAQRQLQSTTESARDAFFAGRYLYLAGDYLQAIGILESVKENENLKPDERAWSIHYLGRSFEELGDLESALDSYRSGWTLSSEVRENGIHFIRLLQQSEQNIDTDLIRDQLAALGPTFRPDQVVSQQGDPDLATFPSGSGFAGFELDTLSIADGTTLDMWLWWEVPQELANGVMADADTIVADSYVIVRQRTSNLILNAGFEWGETVDGFPLGWQRRIYSQEPDSFFVSGVSRAGLSTRAAVASNTMTRESSGAIGISESVQDGIYYLMAGWTKDSGNGLMGRNCRGEEFEPGGPYYIDQSDNSTNVSEEEWTQVVSLAPAVPGFNPDQCTAILINFRAPDSLSYWDDLIWVPIEPPQLSDNPPCASSARSCQ